MNGLTVDGNDVEEVDTDANKAVENIRSGQGTVLLECKTYRWHGHMLGDQELYRSREEVESWKAKCPISRFSKKLVSENIIIADQNEELKVKAREKIEEALDFAFESPDMDQEDIGTDVFIADLPLPEPSSKTNKVTITGSAAINMALKEEMLNDSNVVLLGEDVALGG